MKSLIKCFFMVATTLVLTGFSVSLRSPDLPEEGLVLWLKPEALQSATNGASVELWADASSASNHAVQTNSQKRPSLQNGKVNGHPALMFTANGQRLELPALKIPFETTVFIVSFDQPQIGSGHHGLLAADNSPYRSDGDGYGIGYYKAGYDGTLINLSDGGTLQHLLHLSNQRSRYAWEVFTFHKEGFETLFLRDGSWRDNRQFDRPADAHYHTGYLLGGDVTGRDYLGGIAEVIVYNRTLDSEELTMVHDYLSVKYDIPIADEPEVTSNDPRFFHKGTLILDHSYADQPYVIQLTDQEWIAGVTTSMGEENSGDRYIQILRSTDAGQTWSKLSVLEPPEEQRQPSWGTFLKTTFGRIYCFYNLNRLPAEGVGFLYAYRFSDDSGISWSERYVLPVRETWHDQEFNSFFSWGIDQPLVVGNTVYISFSKFGPTVQRPGEGFFFKSDNILTATDPAQLNWEMLPAGDHGLLSGVAGPLQEEHNIESLGGDDLYCAFRTLDGYIGEAYSTNGAVTWTEPDFVRYVDGRKIKNPRACPMVWRCENGKFLLWFHNNDGRQVAARNQDRNPAWLSGGILQNGRILWSQPEPALFTFFPGLSGMSYPNLVEHDGNFYIATTDKKKARLCQIENTLIENLWIQDTLKSIPQNGLLDPSTPFLPNLDDGGFTITCSGGLPSTGQIWSVEDAEGNGVALERTAEGKVVLEYKDRLMTVPQTWETDEPVQDNSTVTFILDGAANWIYIVVDGLLCDGGDARQSGWTPIPYQMKSLIESALVPVGSASHTLLHDRILSVSETIGMHRALQSIYTTDGFESPAFSTGTVAGLTVNGISWTEWDSIGGNNSHPEWAVVLSGTAYSGVQSLAVGDASRALVRANEVVTNSVSYWDAYYKSEATNHFGEARITFRFPGESKVFELDGTNAVWHDRDDLAKTIATTYGEWDRITVKIDLNTDTYDFYYNGTVAFSGTLGFDAASITSWEIDVTANDVNRSPQAVYSFYVDDLKVSATNPIPD